MCLLDCFMEPVCLTIATSDGEQDRLDRAEWSDGVVRAAGLLTPVHDTTTTNNSCRTMTKCVYVRTCTCMYFYKIQQTICDASIWHHNYVAMQTNTASDNVARDVLLLPSADSCTAATTAAARQHHKPHCHSQPGTSDCCCFCLYLTLVNNNRSN